MLRIVLFILFFLSTLIWGDFVNSIFISIGNINIYPIDILLLFTIIFFVTKSGYKYIFQGNILLKVYIYFLLLIIVNTIRGIPAYSFSAIGESRQIMPLYFFVVSFLLIVTSKNIKKTIIDLEKIIYLAGIAVLIMFIIEIIVGHRVGFYFKNAKDTDYGYLSDARGVRILDSFHTFSACVLVTFILIKSVYKNRITEYYILLIFIPIIVITQNRTAIVSVSLSMIVYIIFNLKRRQRQKLIIGAFLVIIFAIGGLKLISPDRDIANISGIFGDITDPIKDYTGTGQFRYLALLSALKDFSKSPILGEGYGKHWVLFQGDNIYYTGPHNQYISILVKTGVIGLFFVIIIFYLIIKNYYKFRPQVPPFEKQLFETIFIVLIAAIPYGFGYDFFPTFGFFLGIFCGIIYKIEKNKKLCV